DGGGSRLMTSQRTVLLVGLAALLFLSTARGESPAEQLRKLDGNVLAGDADRAKELAQTLSRDARLRREAANRRDVEAWQTVKARDDWEKFRDVRLTALRASLGDFPDPPKDLHVQVTRTLEGDGVRIEDLVFVSRPGLVVTANLYSPKEPGKSMPGI